MSKRKHITYTAEFKLNIIKKVKEFDNREADVFSALMNQMLGCDEKVKKIFPKVS